MEIGEARGLLLMFIAEEDIVPTANRVAADDVDARIDGAA